MSQPRGGAGQGTVGSVSGQPQTRSSPVTSLGFLQHFCSISLLKIEIENAGVVWFIYKRVSPWKDVEIFWQIIWQECLALTGWQESGRGGGEAFKILSANYWNGHTLGVIPNEVYYQKVVSKPDIIQNKNILRLA